jgi:hypothetical protein
MSYAVRPAGPDSLTTLTATALQIKAYNTKLRTESVLNDVYDKLSESLDYSEKGAVVPDAIFLKLEKAPTGAHSITVPLLMRLQGAPTYGTSTLVGNEESLRLKHMTVYYNLIRKAVATETYGVNYQDVSAYDLYGQVGPMMTDYFAELRGRRIREASMLTLSEELTQAPISLKHLFNQNIFIPNVLLGGMPVGDTRDLSEATGTWPNNGAESDSSGSQVAHICAKLCTATITWTKPEYCNLSVSALLALDHYCKYTVKLEPIMIGGQTTLIFCLPADQLTNLLNPTNSTTNIGNIWKNVMALREIEQYIPGAYCRVKNLLLVEDSRYPTLTVGGYAATPTYTLTPGFMQPGNDDGRNTSAFANATNLVFEVGFVYGKGALCEWITQPLKYATEAYDYEMVKGKGAYQCAGIQLVRYNVDATSSNQVTTEYQRACVMVIMSPATLVSASAS